MKIINSAEVGRDAVERLLTKKSFDEVELSPKVRDANKKIFGEDLTAIEIVRRIVGDVRKRGDSAVVEWTRKIDGVELESFALDASEVSAAVERVKPEVFASLKVAAENIRRFHAEQLPKSWITYRGANSLLGQAVVPLNRVGVYVPGGTAAYPSSVLMNVIPAKVAGVGEVVMCTPNANPHVLAAAHLAGVDRIFKIGGAQAIAAMAFGTDQIGEKGSLRALRH